MPEQTYSREIEMNATKASARLPRVDIDVIHRQSPSGDWEQISINIRAMPSFEAIGRSFEAADPFALRLKVARLMWIPWLLTAQTMMLPEGPTRTLPNASSPLQEAPKA